jgi:Tfp pilus assembly protein PilF
MMKRITMLLVAILLFYCSKAQKRATVRESKKAFTTYDFSDPNPVADAGRIYPYYRFDGYTNTPRSREWKVVELENDYIKVMVLPEIGGKIWAAWEKSSGKPFTYYNQVVKFRDVAMRGPWTSGGIEANYGIIGHTPNCATPVDYMAKTNADGSVSCFIGTLDLLTQTYWTIEINLPGDKAYFTTRSFWNNTTPLEQPYYTWMNVGMPAKGNLEFIYPGNRHIGHSGEYSDWKINPSNGKDISFYANNNFGGPKSYHVIGKYSDFFGAYYHDDDFGMARYSLRDEKPGRKIWIWGLSRNGMIWEQLLTDNDGQYVEVQSGRLFNQAADGSNYTPFKQLGFAPHTTDVWTEYWFPVIGTKGFVKANPYGALNVRVNQSTIRIDFSPLQSINDELTIHDGERLIYSKKLQLAPLTTFSDSVTFTGNVNTIRVTLGGKKLQYNTDPNDGILDRPVDSPENFDWNSVFGLYTLGKEFIQQRYYARAEEKLLEVLKKDPNYLPALAHLAMISYRNFDCEKTLAYARHALSIDTYDPAANFYYALANLKLGKIADARDGFEIASLSPSYRGAAYTELSKIYFRENDYDKAKHYATRSLESNAGNTIAWQTLALINRKEDKKEDAEGVLRKLQNLTPLNHFIRFEKFRWDNSELAKNAFTSAITNELPHETCLELADFYASLGLIQDAVEVLTLSPANPEVYYRIAYLMNEVKAGNENDFIEKANKMSPLLVFPFRASSADALEWVMTQTQDWKPRYFLGLIHWSRNHTDRAKLLFAECGLPDFAPFYAVRAELYNDERYRSDLKRAAQLDPGQWRYGIMLADHLIASKNYAEALSVASDYHKRFAGDFRINMLLAKALLLNKRYKAVTDLLEKTTILPYEGATDGHQLYREAWLMRAVEQLKERNYKAALASVNKAKLWPEHLGAGKPYDDMLDLRLESYVEALVYEKSKQEERAQEKLMEITKARQPRQHQITDLITALAYKKTSRGAEGEQVLKAWLERQPDDKIAKWAYAVYSGRFEPFDIEGDGNFRVIKVIVDARL